LRASLLFVGWTIGGKSRLVSSELRILNFKYPQSLLCIISIGTKSIPGWIEIPQETCLQRDSGLSPGSAGCPNIGPVNQLFDAMATGFGMVLQYFFGSSKGSADKNTWLMEFKEWAASMVQK
jgi:hypothetical protein